MAKNTFSSAFRKIDVDQYNEDNYREEEQAELQSTTVGPDEAEIMALMNQYPYSNYKRNLCVGRMDFGFFVLSFFRPKSV